MSTHKTPLRYPGGKQKISQFIVEIIHKNNLLGCHYVEPYAGGAGIAIELLLKGIVSHIHLNDIHPAVYAFWHSILHHTDEFCCRISRASLNVEEWRRQREIFRSPKGLDRLDVGFSMFYLNRCNRSGILSGGVIGGLKQEGKWKIDARFPRTELIRRIEAIASLKKSIRLRNWDADKYISVYIKKLPPQTLIYCDPPYFHKADTLYQNHYTPDDHLRISNLIQKEIQQPWVVSYDSNPIIEGHYKKRKYFIYPLKYSASKAYEGEELFVFSDSLKVPQTSSIKYIDQVLFK